MVALRNNGFLSLDNNNENKDGETNWNQKEKPLCTENEKRSEKKQPKQIIQKNKRKILWLFCCGRRIESGIQYNSRKKRSCLRKPNYQLNNTCYCGIYSHVHSPSHTAHLIIFSCLLFISLSPAPSLHLSLTRSLHIAVSIAISVYTDLFCCSFISFIYSFHTDGWRWFFWWSFVCAFAK